MTIEKLKTSKAGLNTTKDFLEVKQSLSLKFFWLRFKRRFSVSSVCGGCSISNFPAVNGAKGSETTILHTPKSRDLQMTVFQWQYWRFFNCSQQCVTSIEASWLGLRPRDPKSFSQCLCGRWARTRLHRGAKASEDSLVEADPLRICVVDPPKCIGLLEDRFEPG